MKSPCTFKSGGFTISAIAYLPDDYNGQKLPGIVVCHPAGGVKEQTAGLYAEQLSKQGFATLAFDAARQGESSGEPRHLEDPFQRAEDIRNAVAYLATRPWVEEDHVGLLGICAAGSYTSYAAQTDYQIKALATVSAVDPAGELLEDKEMKDMLIKQTGIFRNLEQAGGGSWQQHVNPGTREEAESYPPRSMFRESYDYYVDSHWQRPHATGWGDLRYDMLAHYHPFEHMEWIAPRPVLMIVGSEADTAHWSKQAVEKAGDNAELIVIPGASHMDMYYKDKYVDEAVKDLSAFFHKYLG